MTYKMFCLDRDGECMHVRELLALHDADAIDQVEFMRMPYSCELWHRAGFVTTLPATVVDPA